LALAPSVFPFSEVHTDKDKYDLDVGVSGSESPDEASSDVETASDRLFANDFNPTQAPRGYNQRAVYRAGLSTQAGPAAGLNFRKRHDSQAFLGKARRPVLLTDDEDEGASENEYELGSFVCDDDDEVVFASEFWWRLASVVWLAIRRGGLGADVLAGQSDPMSCS
jgi:hypothetical protein